MLATPLIAMFYSAWKIGEIREVLFGFGTALAFSAMIAFGVMLLVNDLKD